MDYLIAGAFQSSRAVISLGVPALEISAAHSGLAESHIWRQRHIVPVELFHIDQRLDLVDWFVVAKVGGFVIFSSKHNLEPMSGHRVLQTEILFLSGHEFKHGYTCVGQGRCRRRGSRGGCHLSSVGRGYAGVNRAKDRIGSTFVVGGEFDIFGSGTGTEPHRAPHVGGRRSSHTGRAERNRRNAGREFAWLVGLGGRGSFQSREPLAVFRILTPFFPLGLARTMQ